MPKRKVLYICHNHPTVRPGGAEAYAYELFRGMQASGEFETVFLAKGGPPVTDVGRVHCGTYFAPANASSDEYFFYTDGYRYDWLNGTMTAKDIYTRHFRSFLRAFKPDIVHFQHTLYLGYDLIREVRNTLPDAAILYTLHEFLPICHRRGQMVRTGNDELCTEESPRRCHECFPDVSKQSFFMRKRFIQSHFSLVDKFLAPSRFLMERYIDWGIPPEKIVFEDYGRLPVLQTVEQPGERLRNRLGFFGQFTPFKGVHVLLEAMKILLGEDDPTSSLLSSHAAIGHRPERHNGQALQVDSALNGYSDKTLAHLWLHGANLEQQPGTYQNEFNALLEATRQNVTLVGRYTHDDLPQLMSNVDWVVVPSIWWENSPLVIQEAFLHRRPVICSDIGGMAEKVTHGIDGLHFKVGDPGSLAQVIQQAVSTPHLFETLQSGIKEVYSMDDHVRSVSRLYESLLDRVAVAG
jgi:glycosyltransferase involved in cell wall biosynthesis